MKKTFFKYSYLFCFSLLFACQDNDPPLPDSGTIEDQPEAREAFFRSIASHHQWRLSKLTFAEPTVVAELSEDPVRIDSTWITDLYAQLPTCRLDDIYTFGFEYGDVHIDFKDQYESSEERCNAQEPSFIERGIYLEFNDSLSIAQASFRNTLAVNQFFGFRGSSSGSGYLGYNMEWKVESLSADSINISATFLKRELPDLAIQFVSHPLKD